MPVYVPVHDARGMLNPGLVLRPAGFMRIYVGASIDWDQLLGL